MLKRCERWDKGSCGPPIVDKECKRGVSVVRYRFFQRDGGVSQGRFAGLNLSYHVGDDHFHVDENRRRVKEAMGAARLVSARQVHGDRIFLVEGGETGDFEVDGYDALITTEPGTALLVQQADCQAVLLHDPACRAVAAIHCGWRGSVAGLIGKTVALMSTALQNRSPSVRSLYRSVSWSLLRRVRQLSNGIAVIVPAFSTCAQSF